MSYSWAFFGDFKIPAARLESLKVAESPWLTTLESIRDDAALSDWIYDGTQFHYRSLFDKSDHQDKREIIDTLLAAVVAHGGEGTGTYIGFDDGGPDAGEVITIKRGVVTHAPFSSAKEAAAIRAGRGYQALRARVAEAFEPINRVAAKSRASTKPKAAPRSRAMSRSAGGLVSTLRMPAVAAGAVVSSASTARFAPFLDIRHPDCRETCGLFASLFFGSGGDRYTFKMSEHALHPLLELATNEPAARHALASAAGSLWRGHAYPETRACIEALLPFESEAPWARTQFRLPWQDQQPSSLTGPRQVALMHLYRAECLLALGEAEAGERAFEHAIERAERAAVPSYMQLSSASQYWGTHADFRLFALVRSAYALRLRLLGQDACLYRKIAKSKQAPKSDPVGLATATRYAESALVVVAARAPEQYAGLTPKPIEGHEFTPSQSAYHWQWRAYLEAALLDEMNENLDRARHRVGQAKFLAALEDPSHDPTQDHVRALVECVARLGAVNTPLDTGAVSPSRLARSRAAPVASKPQTPAEKRLAARRQSARNDSGWITTELYGMVTGGKHKQARALARELLADGADGGPIDLGPDAWTNLVETFIRTNDMKTDFDLFELIRRKLDAGEPVYIGAPILVSNVCHVLNTLERFEECVALVDRCFAALGSKPMQLLDRKLYAAVNGTLPSADDLVRDVMENPERWKSIQPRGIPMVLAACWFAKKRDRPRLLDALKLARKNGYRDFSWAKEDPGLAHYLDDREVKALF